MSVLSNEKQNELFGMFNPDAPDIFLGLVEQATIDAVVNLLNEYAEDGSIAKRITNDITNKLKDK